MVPVGIIESILYGEDLSIISSTYVVQHKCNGLLLADIIITLHESYNWITWQC